MYEGLLTYSWRVGRLFDTEVKIHWTLPVMLLFFMMQSHAFQTGAWEFGIVVVVLPWLLLFQSVLMHEFGHVFAARHYQMPTHEVILHPLGGLAVIGGQSRTPKEEFVIAAAGPLVNVALIILGMAVYLALGAPFHLGMLWPFIDSGLFEGALFRQSMGLWLLYNFIVTQSVLVLFNVCMLAYPMDGGRMLMAGLWARVGHGRALFLSLKIAQGFALLMGAAALWWREPFLIVIAFVIFVHAIQMLKQLPHISPGLAQDSRFEYVAWQQQGQRRTAVQALKKRPGPIRRWLNRLKAKREVRVVEDRLNTRRRVDELLDKITSEGISSLTDEEKAYLKQASQQYQGQQSNRP